MTFWVSLRGWGKEDFLTTCVLISFWIHLALKLMLCTPLCLYFYRKSSCFRPQEFLLTLDSNMSILTQLHVSTVKRPFSGYSVSEKYKLRRSYMNQRHCNYIAHLSIMDTYSLHVAVLLEKLTVSQLVKKFPEFYATIMFITAFTTARHLSLSWASSIQSIPPHPTSWRSILILSSHLHLRLLSGLFPSGFPTKTVYTLLLLHSCYMARPSHSSRCDNVWWAVQIIKLLIM